jgi:hypothetical protein
MKYREVKEGGYVLGDIIITFHQRLLITTLPRVKGKNQFYIILQSCEFMSNLIFCDMTPTIFVQF